MINPIWVRGNYEDPDRREHSYCLSWDKNMFTVSYDKGEPNIPHLILRTSSSSVGHFPF